MSIAPLQQAVDVARSVLANVSSEQLSDPTPCASWDVAALINHMVGGAGFFLSGITGSAPSSSQQDFAAGDFNAAYEAASSECLAAFSGDGAMERTCTLPFGEMPGSAFMGLATTDTFQHAWDLAKATGQDTDLAPALAEALLAQSKMSIQDAFRGPEGAPFGPEQPAESGSSAADRLAAFLGRQV